MNGGRGRGHDCCGEIFGGHGRVNGGGRGRGLGRGGGNEKLINGVGIID